ncbi:sulfurtransferase TusA family protein [Rhizobium leguminosarum]|uniref:sulfurtransferase TusA family protein n=1 Tax=Rhizobium leguminosarum TaxID=384 RepID=UPI0014418005|nr:sulfurtransferase TusA family protein [Rhizobium leguminosarum]NKL74837.1 response regulator SirA [Rhizobium leguminosarum bv. viciae]
MTPDNETSYLLDMKGLRCPVPVARTRKAIKKLPPGVRIKVECTDPLADIDIPHMVNTDGHSLLDKGVDGNAHWYLIQLKTSLD